MDMMNSHDAEPADYSAYRAALALNNLSVTMMHRGCFGPAVSTLCDCLTTMQLAFVPKAYRKARHHNSTVGTNTSAILRARLNQIVVNASRRYRRTMKLLSKRDGNSLQDTAASFPEVVPLDNDDISGLLSVAQYGPSFSMVSPIRIVGVCDNAEGDQETDEIIKHFGIMLYNHGLASFLVATTTNKRSRNQPSLKHKKTQNKYLQRSHKSLEMAERTLLQVFAQGHESYMNGQGRHCRRPTSHSPPCSITEDSSVRLLLAITLNSLSTTLSMSDESNSVSRNVKPNEPQETQRCTTTTTLSSSLCLQAKERASAFTRNVMPPSRLHSHTITIARLRADACACSHNGQIMAARRRLKGIYSISLVIYLVYLSPVHVRVSCFELGSTGNWRHIFFAHSLSVSEVPKMPGDD